MSDPGLDALGSQPGDVILVVKRPAVTLSHQFNEKELDNEPDRFRVAVVDFSELEMGAATPGDEKIFSRSQPSRPRDLANQRFPERLFVEFVRFDELVARSTGVPKRQPFGDAVRTIPPK